MNFTRKQGVIPLTLAVALAWPARADAHLVSTGLGPVYDGISHWASTAEDVVPVMALAILAGLRGPATSRQAMLALPLAWLLGGILGMILPASPEFSRPVLSGMIAATFLAPGLLALSDWVIPPLAVSSLAAAIGLVHGFLDAGGLRSEGATTATGILQFLGMTVTLFVLTTLLAALVVSLKQPWMRIVARVASSWIAAAGLLLLGWSLRGTG